MAFGLPAYHTENYSAGGSRTELRAAAKKALDSLIWSIREETTERIIASTSISFRSWSEKVIINCLPDNTISVTSTCALRTQCLDWGKNEANVRKFMAELMKHVEQGAPPDRYSAALHNGK